MCDICIVNPNRKGKNGRLLEEWVSLPISEEKIFEVFASIGIESEFDDYFINDAETQNFAIDIDRYTDFLELNELAKKIDALEACEDYKLAAYLEWKPHLSISEISKVIDELDKFDYLDEVYNGADFESYCIRQFGSLDALPPEFQRYAKILKYDNGISYSIDIFYSSLGVIIRTG